MPDPLFVRSVEYPIVEHCNLSCQHCDHASPLLPKRFANLDRYSRDLDALSPVLHAQEFRLLGGEPLLHPDLLDFLSVARKSQIANTITLVTNGTLLHQAPSELWKLIDRLWVSVYPRVISGWESTLSRGDARKAGSCSTSGVFQRFVTPSLTSETLTRRSFDASTTIAKLPTSGGVTRSTMGDFTSALPRRLWNAAWL